MINKKERLNKKMERLDFATPVFMRVFSFFLSHPSSRYHQRETSRLTEVSLPSANKMLNTMVSLGFVKMERKGNMIFYELNAENYIVRQFKVLLNVYALAPLIESTKNISTRIILFGSCSAGTDTENSDFDLFILTKEKEAVMEKIRAFNHTSAREVSPLVVDINGLVKLKNDDKSLYENIIRGILLYDKGDYGR